MHDSAQVNQQPGVSPPQFDLGGIEQVEHDIRDELLDGKRADLPRALGLLRRTRPPVPGATARLCGVHHSQPPGLPGHYAAMLTRKADASCALNYRNRALAQATPDVCLPA